MLKPPAWRTRANGIGQRRGVLRCVDCRWTCARTGSTYRVGINWHDGPLTAKMRRLRPFLNLSGAAHQDNLTALPRQYRVTMRRKWIGRCTRHN
jgi:hypothetical protein